MIKRYTQFVNEGINKSKILLSRLRDEWRDDIESVCSEQRLRDSYTSIFRMREKHDEPFDDYIKFQSFMDDKGFDIEAIKDLFSEESNKILGKDIFDEIEGKLDDRNGYIDIYLYFTIKALGLDANRYNIGGFGLLEPEDTLVKYGYGYHKSKYGLLYLNQIGVTEEEFIKNAHIAVVSVLYEEWSTIISNITGDNWGDDLDYLNYRLWIITEEDRVIIFTGKLLTSINSQVDNKITKEQLDEAFVEFLSLYDFEDFDITNNEIVINSEIEEKNLLNNTNPIVLKN